VKGLPSYLAAAGGNLLAGLLGLVFALLAGEGLVRTFSPCPDYGGGIRPAFYSNLFEYDRQLGWKGVSNLSTPYYSKDFRITVSHDAATERYGYPKPAFVLTDSGLELTNVPVPHKAEPQDIPVNFIPEPNDWTSRIQLLNFVLHNLPGLIAQFEQHGQAPENATLPHETLQKITQLGQLLSQQGTQHSTFRSRKLPNTDLWLDAHYSPYGQALLARHIEQFTVNKQ
jgi:hypothetical protein